jgi:hypothetical protein
MKLRKFSENKEQGQITFAIEDNNTSAHQGRELIVVNYNVEDPVLAYKKKLIADYLWMIAFDKTEINWRTIDREISEIMNTKIHMI